METALEFVILCNNRLFKIKWRWKRVFPRGRPKCHGSNPIVNYFFFIWQCDHVGQRTRAVPHSIAVVTLSSKSHRPAAKSGKFGLFTSRLGRVSLACLLHVTSSVTLLFCDLKIVWTLVSFTGRFSRRVLPRWLLRRCIVIFRWVELHQFQVSFLLRFIFTARTLRETISLVWQSSALCVWMICCCGISLVR